MCKYCDDAGLVNVKMFFDYTRSPIDICIPCDCHYGSHWWKGGLRFDSKQIGHYYSQIMDNPIVFVDNRVYAKDIHLNKIVRCRDKVLLPDVIKFRLKM